MITESQLDPTEAAHFFTAWQQLSVTETSLLVAWREFFQGWEEIAKHEAPLIPKPELDCLQFQFFAQEFPVPYKNYLRSGVTANIWTAAGLGHDELRNSAVLAWLLDSFGDHGQGSRILGRLLDEVDQGEGGSINQDSLRKPYWTNTETLPLGELDSRVDIEIESPEFLIFIEVKIQASETNDQLDRYVRLAQLKATGRPSKVFFLSPNGRLPSDPTLHQQVIPVSWGQVAKLLREHVKAEIQNTFAGHIIEKFADHVMSF